MITAAEVRHGLSDVRLRGLKDSKMDPERVRLAMREIILPLAAGSLEKDYDAAKLRLDRMADLARRLAVAEWERRQTQGASDAGAFRRSVDSFGMSWPARARALESREDACSVPAPLTAGRLCESGGDGRLDLPDGVILDGALISEAVAVSVCSSNRQADKAYAMERESRSLFGVDSAALDRRDRAMKEVLKSLVRNGLTVGKEKAQARAEALAAAVTLRGRALARIAGKKCAKLAFAAGAASGLVWDEAAKRSIFAAGQEKPMAVEAGPVRKASAVSARLQRLNYLRQHIWESDAARPDGFFLKLGAAAAGSAFGFPGGWNETSSPAAHAPALELAEDGAEEVMLIAGGAVPVRLPAEWLARLGHLSLSGALDRLERLAVDRRQDAGLREKFGFLADLLRTQAAGWNGERVSFRRYLGLTDSSCARGGLRSGQKVFAAAPPGRYPAVLECRGRRGRLIRCKALADEDGALVGYGAYDSFSHEYHGEGRWATYGLDGRRFGSLVRRETGDFVTASEPRGGFVSMPETLAGLASLSSRKVPCLRDEE